MFKSLKFNRCLRNLGSQDPKEREKTAYKLGELGERCAVKLLIETLVDIEGNVRKASAIALTKLGESKWQELVKGDDFYDFVRLGSSGVLDLVEPLIKALSAESPSARGGAAKALASLGDKRAVKSLIRTLRDKNSSVKVAAIMALGQLGDNQTIKPLIEPLRDFHDSSIRKAAAEAMGRLGDKSATQPLIDTLKDSIPDVRQAAAVALCQLGDPKAIEPLREGLKNGRLSPLPIPALGKFANEEFVHDARKYEVYDFVEKLKAPHLRVREAAARSLIKLALSEPTLVQDTWDEIRDLIRTSHKDSHEDVPGVCGINHHVDTGIGMDFPESPPKEQLDF